MRLETAWWGPTPVYDRMRLDEHSALPADLVYAHDEAPGISRRKHGTGFSYTDADGQRITDRAEIERINALAIPPAWSDVWVSPDPNGHLQATGRDQKGRKQYRYHAQWSACRDAVKYSSLESFGRSLTALREQVDADMRRRNLGYERVAASVVWLLDHTMIRVGNSAYARDNKSFGLTTLRNRHVDVEGERLRFHFKGKSGKQWQLGLVDRRVARLVRSVQDLPGQNLFQYLDADDNRHSISSSDINAYIQSAIGREYSSKHFRTWGGTVRALTLFSEAPLPETKTARNRTANTLIDAVASRLGNTRAVCRRCYIHPQVFNSWEEGTLRQELAGLRQRGQSYELLDEEEGRALGWLARTSRQN
ncbi:DNA topoisomerase [Devosia pacifica]|uniref:DNA topoisomerase n=1 Tax=Devosia pacifica TaxID=1335967 RepID=A0A918VU10_9HYPH|nr:DNA topoisomerase IB [Devosia pacifica]GHA25396.1 DNA topoisomerase [Devosia pacifica]